MGRRIEKVTIVGGGTAGWLAAATLDRFLNERRDGPPVEVTLIESPRVPTIGVGEATVPGMRPLLQRLGLDEGEFLLRCNASFKYAVRFSGWNNDRQGRPIDFYHPFNAPQMLHGKDPAYHFHRFGRAEGRTDLIDTLMPNPAVIGRMRAPRPLDGPDYDATIRYSYHLDAGLFAAYLRDVTVARGVRHIRDDVDEVRLDERGFVRELVLERAGPYPVEFVVDCTGFRSVILGEALGEPFVPWSRHLLCDRAIPVQLPHLDPTALEPCTGATALGAGWVWNVPLYSRVGTGYVFSSAFRTDDEARAEFLGYLAGRGYKVDAAPPVIRMNVGRRRRTWIGNCVAVGLSAGFVEPLEATAIYTIAVACRHIASNFPDRDVSPALARRFDKSMTQLYDNILDFIVMHYYTANRDEPFWRAARGEVEVPDSLLENLELWRHALPAPADISGVNLFAPWSFLAVLYAKGWFDDVEFPIGGSIARADWDAYVRHMAEVKRGLVAGLPGHYELLTHIRNRAARRMFGAGPGEANPPAHPAFAR